MTPAPPNTNSRQKGEKLMGSDDSAPDAVRRHPDYSEGFYDARDGEPLYPGAAPEYEAGWRAFYRAKEILNDAGMTQRADGSFSIAMKVSPNTNTHTPKA